MHKQKTTCVVIHCNFIPYNGLVTRLKKYQGPFRGSIILLGMYFWPGCYNWSIIYVEKERNIWLLLFWFVKLLKKIGTRAKSRNMGEIKKKISVALYPVFLYTLDKIIFSLHFQSSVQNMPRQKLYIKYEIFFKVGGSLCTSTYFV